MQALARDLGCKHPVLLFTDSSTAKGVASRSEQGGSGMSSAASSRVGAVVWETLPEPSTGSVKGGGRHNRTQRKRIPSSDVRCFV